MRVDVRTRESPSIVHCMKEGGGSRFDVASFMFQSVGNGR